MNWSPEEFEIRLKAALKLELPYSERSISETPSSPATPSAVLVLLGWPDKNGPVGPAVLLTKRTETVETHKGQYAFPGGRVEPKDLSPVLTALRETEEEIGIGAQAVRVLGELPELWTPTGYRIVPVVGILNGALNDVPMRMNPQETADAFWVPLEVLYDAGTYRCEIFQAGVASWPIHVYQVGNHRIWGATGAMLKNLLDRLQSLR